MNALDRFIAALGGCGQVLAVDGTAMVRVDRADKARVEQLFQLHTAAMRPEVEQLTAWDVDKQMQRMTHCLDEGVAYAAAGPAGLRVASLLTPADDGAIELSYLYVAPAEQNQGMGGSVCRALQGYASIAGVDIVLGVLKGCRPRKLYERLGWRPDGENRWEDRFRWSCSEAQEKI